MVVAIYWHRTATSPSQVAPSTAPSSPLAQPDLPRRPVLAGTPSDVPEASVTELAQLTIQSLSSSDSAVREHAVAILLPSLAQRDVVAAARIADLLVESPLRPRILSAVARAWTDQNRSHALDWAQTLPDPNERETVLVEIFSRISQSDPAEAVRLRQQLATDPVDDAELTNLAQRWAESDLSAVLGWTDSLPPGTQRDQLHARAAFIQSQSNPAEAAQLVLDRIPRGDAQAEALISVVHQWARRDFAAASAWVERIPDAVLRERATHELEAVGRSQS